MPKRLISTKDGSNKFWEASVQGKSLVVRFGRVGTDGQTKSKGFPDPTAAKKELARLRAEKLGKGYVEAAGAATAAKPAKPTRTVGPEPIKPVKKPEAAPTGALVDAFFRFLRDCRKHGDRALARQYKALAAVETRPSYRTLFELLAVHTPMGFGDILGFGLGPVCRADGTDRTDVVGIAADGAGDVYAIAAPGTSDSARIQRFRPRDGWRSDAEWSDLEDWLKDIDADERAQLEGDHPGDEAMWRTTLQQA